MNPAPQSITESNRSPRNATQGFTLIELVFVVGIMTIISGALLSSFLSLEKSMDVAEAKVLTTDNTRIAMMVMIRELRQANAATYSVDQVTIDGQVTDILSYVVAVDLDGNGWPIDSAGDVEYSPLRTLGVNPADPTQLIRTEVGSDDKVLAITLSDDPLLPVGVTFTVVGDNGIRITLSGADDGITGQGRTVITTLSETVTLRN